MKHGTLTQLLHCARQGDQSGQILNALNFPLGEADMSPKSYTTDKHAWAFTKTLENCHRENPYPADDMSWGLAGLKGAFHHIHIDSDGFGTTVMPICGDKVWFAARPKPCDGDADKFDMADFASTGTFLAGQFDPFDPCSDRWDMEAIVLDPGTLL